MAMTTRGNTMVAKALSSFTAVIAEGESEGESKGETAVAEQQTSQQLTRTTPAPLNARDHLRIFTLATVGAARARWKIMRASVSFRQRPYDSKRKEKRDNCSTVLLVLSWEAFLYK